MSLNPQQRSHLRNYYANTVYNTALATEVFKTPENGLAANDATRSYFKEAQEAKEFKERIESRNRAVNAAIEASKRMGTIKQGYGS